MNLRCPLIALGVAVVFFALFPDLDLWLADRLYTAEAGFFLDQNPLVLLIYHGVEWMTGLALIGAVLILSGALLSNNEWLKSNRHNAAFFLLAVVLGPGLVVNGVFKEHWGRARPAQITEFGGSHHYTPPLQVAQECSSNCSFSCGHASMGFAFLAFGFLFPRHRRSWFALGITLGLVVGLGRMMQGRHFFSDVIFSGIFVCMTTLWLHYLFEQFRHPESRLARFSSWAIRREPLSNRSLAGASHEVHHAVSRQRIQR